MDVVSYFIRCVSIRIALFAYHSNSIYRKLGLSENKRGTRRDVVDKIYDFVSFCVSGKYFPTSFFNPIKGSQCYGLCWCLANVCKAFLSMSRLPQIISGNIMHFWLLVGFKKKFLKFHEIYFQFHCKKYL